MRKIYYEGLFFNFLEDYFAFLRYLRYQYRYRFYGQLINIEIIGSCVEFMDFGSFRLK